MLRKPVFLMFSVLVLAISANAGLFVTPQTYAVGNAPTNVAAADFNGDGKSDLVVANSGEQNLGLLLGNGDGTFHSQILFGGVSASMVLCGEWNHDGKPDIAAYGRFNFSPTFFVFLGNGDGTFKTPNRYSPGGVGIPFSMSTADLNGDGLLDLAIGTDVGIVVALGNGDGTFQPSKTYGIGAGPRGAAVGDFNQDGKLDLVQADAASNNVYVFLGRGDGTFDSPINSLAGKIPMSVAAVDFDKDGKLDLAVTNNGAKSVAVLYGNGDGTFRAPVNQGVGSQPAWITSGDLDGDGLTDLAVINQGDSTGNCSLTILFGTTSGGFQASSYVVDSKTISVTLADVTGDGRPEVLAPSAINNTVTVLRNNGYGGLLAPRLAFLSGKRPWDIAPADFNEDGIADLAFTRLDDSDLLVMLGLGAGLFGPPSSTVGLGRPPGETTAVADFNLDGHLDIASSGELIDEVDVLLGSGDGTFQPAKKTYNNSALVAFVVGDLNRDGVPDIVALENYSSVSRTDVSILLGRGDGSFRREGRFGLGQITDPFWVAVGDVNKDGNLDVLATDFGKIHVFLGRGDGTLRVGSDITISASGLAVADLNQDGNLDLVMSDGTNFKVLFGNGDGTFKNPVAYSGGNGVGMIVIADLNGDGILDFAGPDFNDGRVVYLLGNGDGTFQPFQSFGCGVFPKLIAVQDMNGDGRPDIVITTGAGVAIALNASGS